MMCDICDQPAHICRVRRGQAAYFCSEHMNAERDKGVKRGDVWFAVKP